MPVSSFEFSLSEVLGTTGREAMADRRYDLFHGGQATAKDLKIFGAGDMGLLSSKSVAVVGTRRSLRQAFDVLGSSLANWLMLASS